MRKQLFWGAVALSMMVGCAKETPVEVAPPEPITLTADEAKFLAQADGNTKFDQENIDRIIADAANFLGETSPTRSGSQRTVASIEPLKMALRTTRGGETAEEDMFYVVNFANDEGYSVIAADERIADEIALFVGSGNLGVENVENPGLAIALSRLDDYAERSIEKYEAWQDSVETVMLNRLAVENPELKEQIEAYLAKSATSAQTRAGETDEYILLSAESTYGSWAKSPSSVDPMVPVRWHQRSPYNNYVSQQKGGKDIKAGCVAIAAGQLMAKWGFPTNYWGMNLPWSAMVAGTNNATISEMLWKLGEDVNMDWGVDGSGTDSHRAISMLGRMGYWIPTVAGYAVSQVTWDYTYDAVKSSIDNGRPVYIEGYTDRTNVFLGLVYTYQNGHAWLMDGYLNRYRTVTTVYIWGLRSLYSGNTRVYGEIPGGNMYTTTDTFQQTQEFFHNNWGWGGKDDGWYVPGVFDTGAGAEISTGTPDNTGGTDHHFKYQLNIWSQIHPQ